MLFRRLFMTRRMLLILLLIGLLPNLLPSQDHGINVELIDYRHGLVGHAVEAFVQDTLGLIWIGTENGLIKYDGFDFFRYRQQSDKNSLTGRYVRGLEFDPKGNLWIVEGLKKGLQRYNPRSGHFDIFHYDPQAPNSVEFNFWDIHKDNESNLWVFGIDSTGLHRIKTVQVDGSDSVVFEKFGASQNPEFSLSSQEVWAVDHDHQGNLWVGTSNGLNKLEVATGRIQKFTHQKGEEHSLLYNDVNTVLVDSDQVLWVGTDKGLSYADLNREGELVFDHLVASASNPWSLHTSNPKLSDVERSPRNKTRDQSTIQSGAITSLEEFEPGKILVGTNIEGLTILDKSSGQFSYEINYQVAEKYKMFNWRITSIYRDKSGVFWVGSDNSWGIIKISKNRFTHIKRDDSAETKLGHNEVWSIRESQDYLWVAHHEGVDRYDPVRKTFENYHIGVKGGKHLYVDRANKVWVGTQQGLYYLDEENDRFTPYSLPIYAQDARSKPISNILEDSKGNLWVASWICGITRIDPNGAMTKHYNLEGEGCNTGENGNNVTISIHESLDQRIFAGTFSGLYVYDEVSDNFSLVRPYLDCATIIDGPDSTILVATEDNVHAIRLSDLEVNELVQNETIKSLFHINNLVLDSQNHLWIPTPQAGMWVYDLESKRAQQFNRKQGVQGHMFQFHSVFQAENGTIYAGGMNGFNIFDPTYVMSTEPPDISVVDVTTSSDRKEWDQQSFKGKLYGEESLVFPYYVHSIDLTFVVQDYIAPELNQYEYRLEGFQESWISSSGPNNTATYTNLSPGKYSFRIRGSNSYGSWNEAGISLNIKVLPPPWKTWWAYGLYFLGFITMVTLIRRYELKRIRLRDNLVYEQKEAKRLSELDQVKSNFFANISHEFRTPLSLIKGHAQKLKRGKLTSDQARDLTVLERSANQVLRLVNQMLELSKIEHGTLQLNINKYSVDDLIQYASSQFTSLAEMKQIDFRVITKTDFDICCDAEKIIMVLNNLLANAFKFTEPGGQVMVEIHEAESSPGIALPSVEISISDTGIGIPKEEQSKIFDRFYQVNNSSTRRYEGTGIGLALCKELVELHHGTLMLNSAEETGSTFVVTLPMEHPELQPTVAEVQRYLPTNLLPYQLTEENGASANSHTENIDQQSIPLILVVEDNTDLRRFLVDGLSDQFNVSEAEDGKSGLDQAIKEVPELIISDLMMPEMDGLELCQQLKSDARTSHIPVILLTAKSDRDTKLDSLKLGADDYLLKPFDFDEVLARVNNLISQRQRLQEKYRSGVFLTPENPEKDSIEQRFLNQLSDTIKNNYQDPTLSVSGLAKIIGVSEVQLFRKTKALTGLSANELIRNYRLQVAESLIMNRSGNVSEIAYQVGFNSPSYFTKCFKQKYGKTPREYQVK